MSGHSKWATIKHKKAATDAKRGKEFSMISKMLTIAAKDGGSGDAATNPRLRVALDKARSANMPKDRIQKAIDKGMGKGDGSQIEELVYEGFGPGGVGYMVVAWSDNRNRTAPEVKKIFEKNNGSMGSAGAAGYMFERTQEGFAVNVPMPVDEKVMEQNERLVAALQEQDDVESVYTNMVSQS